MTTEVGQMTGTDGNAELAPGLRLRSVVCSAEVMITRAPTRSGSLTCGGRAMTAADGREPTLEAAAGPMDGTLIGKRYQDEPSGLELLCTSAGKGTLAFDGELLSVKNAKPLPASD
jgi:hypothetical protein